MCQMSVLAHPKPKKYAKGSTRKMALRDTMVIQRVMGLADLVTFGIVRP
jgi:hypothetical protein